MLELVDPLGWLHIVPATALMDFCAANRLTRPGNVKRLPEGGKWQFSQQWQALGHVRWLQHVERSTLLPVDGVALQPILGETSYFVQHVACNNALMKGFVSKELSRLLGNSQSKPEQYKGWREIKLSMEQARQQFVGATFNFAKVCYRLCSL